jgi:hypothetical protein
LEKSKFNSRLIIVALTLLVFVCAIQLAEPVSAAYKIDSGSQIQNSQNGYYKYSWVTYKTGYYSALYRGKVYYYTYKKSMYLKTYIKKTSRTRIRVREYYSDGSSRTRYFRTKKGVVTFAKWYARN